MKLTPDFRSSKLQQSGHSIRLRGKIRILRMRMSQRDADGDQDGAEPSRIPERIFQKKTFLIKNL